MSAAGDDLAAEVHVDVVPDGELLLHQGVHDGIGVLDAAQGLIGEDDSEAEGVVCGIAFPHRDVVIRTQLLGQRGKVQAARSSADDSDAHGFLLGSIL